MKVVPTLSAAGALLFQPLAAGTLEQDFHQPPPEARPIVYWHWMGSNFSKDGITKDLEAMKAAGLGGGLIFNLTSAVQESHAPTENLPWPKQTFRGPEYWEALRHAAAEAQRLGLVIGLHNAPGYSATGGPWIDEDRSMQRLVATSGTVSGNGGEVTMALPVPDLGTDGGWGKTGRKITRYHDVAVVAFPLDRAPAPLAPGDVVDVSKNLSADGELRWKAPAGNWRVYRFGHASTGHGPHPVPDELLGKCLEADKLSAKQSAYHWANVIDPLKKALGPYFGKSFRYIHIDSYEAGNQNWSPAFREDFKRLKGYDPLPWLVTMTSSVRNDAKGGPERIMGSEEQTARFEWDYRDVISTLFYENGWRVAARKIHEAGLEFAWEPYSGPFSSVEGTPLADLPMTEFWTGKISRANPAIVGAAHAAGKRIVSAEAFTGRPEISQWTETPASIRAVGDAQLASGVNLMVLHHWVLQPFGDQYKPGMTMGWWGTHFTRTQTWFEPGKEFFRYLGRCQALLQRGETPADFVSVGAAEGAGDAIPQRALADVRVEEGAIVLPSGRRYAFLSFPHKGAMLPEHLLRLKQLLNAGATVVCARPARSPSLSGYPGCDVEVQSLADELWGTGTVDPVRKVGRGRLFTGGKVDVALRELGIRPVAEVLDPQPANVRIYARTEGRTGIFFVANLENAPARFTASFRTHAMQPELWDAETETAGPAPLWREKDGRTEVDLELGAGKTVFVIFRDKPAEGDRLASLAADGEARVLPGTGQTGRILSSSPASGTAAFVSGRRLEFNLNPAPPIPLAGPWEVSLAPAVGTGTTIQLDALKSLSESDDPKAKYFSGTATYRTKAALDASLFGAGKRVELDLGRVCDLVSVRVNGRDLGVWWHPPFVRDITSALHPGENELELAVANTWRNQLIGDEQFPPDFVFGTDRGEDKGRALKAYPGWFVDKTPRPEPRRLTFSTWFYLRKDSPLTPSGLIGPVRLVPLEEITLK